MKVILRSPPIFEAIRWRTHGDHDAIGKFSPPHKTHNPERFCEFCESSIQKEHGRLADEDGNCVAVCPGSWLICKAGIPFTFCSRREFVLKYTPADGGWTFPSEIDDLT